MIWINQKQKKHQLKELNDFPKYKKLYIRAFDKMIKERLKRGKDTQWRTGEEVFEWWTKDVNQIDGQTNLFKEE